jgi:hypothetical protein
MSISERLQAMQSNREKFRLTLPGLGENQSDLTCFFTKLTVREDEKLRRKHKDFYKSLTEGDIPSFQAMVDLIIIKAIDDEGRPIFNQGDNMFLSGMDVGYITGVATAMMEKLFDVPSVETTEGN